MGIVSASYTIAEVADGVPTGENLLLSTPYSGGRTVVVDKAIKWSGEIGDTYFYVEVSEMPIVGEYYTFSCECNDPDHVLPAAGWMFGLFSQSSDARITMVQGKCATTFQMTSAFLQVIESSQGKFILDDTGVRPSTSSVNLTFSKFKLETGLEATAYCLCVPETVGPQGDSPNAYPQYALKYIGVEPVEVDWQDTIPSGWTMG